METGQKRPVSFCFYLGILRMELTMILKEETVAEFGYKPESLGQGSNKSIKIKCDYCGKVLNTTPKKRKKSNNIVDKDACWDCRYSKRDDIGLVRDGCTNPFARKDIKEKIKKTNLEKYGSESITSTEHFKNKTNATNLKLYGTTKPMQSDIIKRRHKEAISQKYRVDNVSQIESAKENRRETCLEKFGNETFMGSEVGQEKLKEGMQKKYGEINNVFQSEEIKEKIQQAHLEKRGVTHHFKDKEAAAEHGKKVLESKIKNGKIKLYNGKPISEWLKESGYSDSRFRYLINKYGFEDARSMVPHISSLEQIMKIWFDKQNILYSNHFRIGNYIADFFLKDYNVIIECDGVYYHSDAVQSDNNYHVKKRLHYIENGYKPLFFRENEINDKFEIVSSIILNRCGKSRRIYARECKVAEVDSFTAGEFLNENHLMGQRGGYNFVLKDGNEIFSLLQIRRDSTSENIFEISRFCNRKNYTVVGGLSRLLARAEKVLRPSSLFTFIDLRYGAGDHYVGLGFKEVKDYSPSFVWTNGQDIVYRMHFVGNSGYDEGYFKLWDCGQKKFIKTY